MSIWTCEINPSGLLLWSNISLLNSPSTRRPVFTKALTDADILRHRREELHLTQQQVADRANIKLRQYQRFEMGERSLSGPACASGSPSAAYWSWIRMRLSRMPSRRSLRRSSIVLPYAFIIDNLRIGQAKLYHIGIGEIPAEDAIILLIFPVAEIIDHTDHMFAVDLKAIIRFEFRNLKRIFFFAFRYSQAFLFYIDKKFDVLGIIQLIYDGPVNTQAQMVTPQMTRPDVPHSHLFLPFLRSLPPLWLHTQYYSVTDSVTMRNQYGVWNLFWCHWLCNILRLLRLVLCFRVLRVPLCSRRNCPWGCTRPLYQSSGLRVFFHRQTEWILPVFRIERFPAGSNIRLHFFLGHLLTDRITFLASFHENFRLGKLEDVDLLAFIGNWYPRILYLHFSFQPIIS